MHQTKIGGHLLCEILKIQFIDSTRILVKSPDVFDIFSNVTHQK
jgi:hypothetical protein